MNRPDVADIYKPNETFSTSEQNTSSFRVQLPQFIAVTIKNILIITIGCLYGYISILIAILSGNNSNETLKLNEGEISWIGSINLLSASIGCLCTGFLPASLGRKKAMQFTAVPFIIGWIIIGFANRVWHLNFALFLCGFSGGISKGPVVSYAVEVSQPKIRGMLAASISLCFITGMITQYILGAFCAWRTLAFINGLIPTSAVILLFFIPESPYWLLMNNKFQEAQKSLAWLRGWTTVEEIQDEYKMLRMHCNSFDYSEKKGHKCGSTKNYFKKNFLWPLSLVTCLFLMAHLSGTQTLMTYAIKFFENFHVPINKFYAAILLGVANILGSLVVVGFIRFTGKRWMAFISLTCIGISSIVVGSYAYFKNIIKFSLNAAPVLETNAKFEDNFYQWIPLIFLLVITFAANFGLLPIGLILIGEVFSKQTRNTGSGISTAIFYVIGFVVNKVFLKMIALLTIPGMYLFYSSISFFAIVMVYFSLPETEGKLLQEIEDHFAEVTKLQKNGAHKRNKFITQEIRT